MARCRRILTRLQTVHLSVIRFLTCRECVDLLSSLRRALQPRCVPRLAPYLTVKFALTDRFPGMVLVGALTPLRGALLTFSQILGGITVSRP